MKKISHTLQLRVVSEDCGRTILRGVYRDHYPFVGKLWPRERVLAQCPQVRTAELNTQQQSAQHVWAMFGRHTGSMVYTTVLSMQVVCNWDIYSELAQCCCWYCTAVLCSTIMLLASAAAQLRRKHAPSCSMHEKVRLGHAFTSPSADGAAWMCCRC
jgi:hypothetical protein